MSHRSRRSPFFRYSFALLSAGLALTIQLVIQITTNVGNLGVLYPMAFLVAWYLGFGPSVLATCLSAVSVFFVFYEPRFTFYAHSQEDYLRLTIFTLTSIFVAKLIDRGRRAEIGLSASEARFVDASTEGMKSRQALEALQTQFERSAEATGLGVWTNDLVLEQLICSSTMKAHFWMRPDEPMTMKTFYSCLHPDDREPTRAAINATLASQTSYDVEYRTIPPHGEGLRWVRAIGWISSSPAGKPLRFDGITIDITSQRKSQEELERSRDAIARSEEQLRLITDRIPAFVAYLDREGRYQFVNRAYEEWFDVSAATLKGKKRSEFASAETAANAAPYESLALAGVPARYENVLRKESGEEKYLDVEYVPDIDPKTNQVRGVVIVGHDVTGRRIALDEAQKAVRARDDFLSIASHELRTPITGMKIQAQMLQRLLAKNSPLDPTRMRKFADQTDRGLDRMNRLVEDMLDISRIQSGKLTLRSEPTDLAEMAEDLLHRYDTELERAGIQATLEANARPLVSGDRFRLEQVLTNLLTNAIRYAPGGALTLTITVEKETACLRFRDNGPGIPPENRERIFERFERLVPANQVSGLGLGLYIVREIMRAHGGKVFVSTEAGPGACFVLELPTRQPGSSPESHIQTL